MKIPALLQERLNCRSSELLLSQCLGDLYMQFLTMDQKSKERDNTQASKSSIRCRSGSSRTSGSSAEEIMYSLSDVQSSFSGISSPVVRSAESLIVSDSELGAMPKEGFCSAEVNPVSYDNFTVSPAGWKTPLPTTITSQHEASSARATVPPESCDSPESVPFESDSKGRRTWTWMNNQRVKLICSFGGRIIPRPHDGKLRYVGGETRIIAVNRHIRYSELMYKLTESHGIALTLKYQLPEDDLDALVSVSSEDDLLNMMEEHDRLEAAGGSARLRLFLFPAAEYDDYCIQNPDEDGFRSSQLYVDAVNGVPEKTFSKPFESCLIGSAQYVDDRFFPDSTLLRLKGPAIDVGAHEFIMSNMLHQPEAWQVSSPHAFTGPPPEFSSAASSPPVASVQHHPAASGSSLQYFQDRLNKVSVHRQMGSETRFQVFDEAGSGCSTSRQSQQHFPFSDSQRGACSPTSVVFELVSRGEHLHTGDSTSELMESLRQSSNVFNQHLEYSEISSHGHTLISDAQGLHEAMLPQQESPPLLHQHQHQHQHMVLQKQQYEENVQRMEVLQHDTLSQCQSIQQPSLPTFYLHSDNSIQSGISRKMEQRLIYQENCIPATFLQRSASSHAIGTGGQPTHSVSSVSTYHVVAVTPSVTVGPHNLHPQHHLRPNRTFSDSRIDKPCGRRVHYGDQNSKNLQISIPSSRFSGNTTSSDEWGVGHWQQHPILFEEAGHPEADNSSLHLFERYPVLRNQFPDPTASCLSPIYGESSVPPLERTKTRCQVAVLDRACEMSIQNSVASNQRNSRPDYHVKVNQAAEQVTFYPGYEERYSDCGDWIGTGTATQIEYSDKNTGIMFEGGKCIEGHYDLHRNYPRDGFDLPTLLKVGGISDIASPKSEWSMSSGTVPMTTCPASRDLYAATVSQGMVAEDFQLDPSSTCLRPRELNQLSGIPAGCNMFVEHNSSDPALPKADSRLPTATCLSNNSSAIGGARDPVTLLNRAHKFGEPSTCGETSHLQNIYLEENHITALSLSPQEVNGWMIGGTVSNSLGENTPDFLPNIFETVNGMQSTCENVSPCTLIHKDLSDSFEGQVCQVSSAAALSCQSTQLLPAPYPWDEFDPVANDNEQHEPSNVPDLPIYDRSPVGSVNTTASRKIFLDRNEAGNVQSDPVKGTSAGRMSLTGRLAEDMICSVLGSSGNCAKYKGKSLNEEQTDENFELHEGMVVREQDIRGTSKNISPSPLVQVGKKSVFCVEHFPEVITNVKECLGVLAIENGSCEEIKNETMEQIGDKDSNEAGQKGMPCCAAEREAISHGLQIIKNADLEEIRELGSGTFGTVYHGKWRGSDVAIKRIKASCFTGPLSEQERLISDFWKEACTLSQLHHPNVVAFYGVVPDGPDGTLATVTEYMVNGSLKQVLHKKDRTIDRRKRLLIAMDIAFGMEYLHSKNIVHFDLKCENLLVNMRDPHRPICKVGDFGLSKVKHHTLVSGGVRGTLPWMAPELLSGNNSKVTEKIDVFSFGIVMWELLTGEEPYANMHCGAIIGGIVNNTLRPSIPCWCDPAWRSLMERCWSADAADRLTFSEVASELRGIAATMNLK